MGGTGGLCGIYAWAHSHVWGAPFRQSSSACRLESIDLVPSLIGAEERAIIRAVGTALYFVRLSPEPQLECGEPGPRTWQPIAGCLGGRGQHPANADGHFAVLAMSFQRGPAMECTGGQARRRINSRPLPCWCPFRTRDQTAHVGWASSDQQRGEALPRPRCWRPA